ncbi:hypothetical protein J6590_022548 [Homalodisca vitripennis]|nr:hypothetical protein J6590_022548 [Homalodisca vitripennis]
MTLYSQPCCGQSAGSAVIGPRTSILRAVASPWQPPLCCGRLMVNLTANPRLLRSLLLSFYILLL